jgi:hypothetical protein
MMCRRVQDQVDIRDPERAGIGYFACFKPLVNTWENLNANAQGNPRQGFNLFYRNNS